jgi:hypothetical protein
MRLIYNSSNEIAIRNTIHHGFGFNPKSTGIDENRSQSTVCSALPAFNKPAAAKINGPWQIAAISFPESENCLAQFNTDSFMARYSGALPPGITSASYLLKSTSLKVALRLKLCPGFSV